MAPERSLAQRMSALQSANEIRTKRATLKRDLKAGRSTIHDLLLDPPEYVLTAKVFDMLIVTPKYGRVKVNKVLRLCRIAPSKTVGGLSPRQRTELVSMLRRPTRAAASTRSRTPGGTTPGAQHMRALGLANGTRLDRSEIKRQVASGKRAVAEVLRDRPAAAETMTVADLLLAQHRWGRERTRRFLASVPMLESTTVAAMTTRLRAEVIRRLVDPRPQEPPPPRAKPLALVPAATAMTPRRVPVISMEVYRARTARVLHLASPGSLYTLCGKEPDHRGMRLVADREWSAPGANHCRACSRNVASVTA